jgi:cytochrome c oxidase subunit 3
MAPDRLSGGGTPDGARVIPITRGLRRPFVANLGMAVFLGSWGITFVGLAAAYLIVWSRNAVWPPPGTPAHPLLFPLLNTVIALASSVTFDFAVRGAKHNEPFAVRGYLQLTAILGTAFLALQSILWTRLHAAGFVFGLNNYVGMFYALTVFHGLHVVVGVIMLGILLWRTSRREYTAMDHTSLRLCGWFWHFVTGMWLAVFALLWLL